MPCSDGNSRPEDEEEIEDNNCLLEFIKSLSGVDKIKKKYNSLYSHHIQMELELEHLREIVKIAKSGVDITTMIIPKECEPWKPEK